VIKPDTIAKFTQQFKTAQLFTGPCENNKKISNAPNIILIFSKQDVIPQNSFFFNRS
jgi:hypothetical protein